MRVFIFLYLLFIATNQLWSQSLDYARDVFFYDKPLSNVKDYYYHYSPLLYHISGYGGKGLHVVIACPEETSLTIAKRNIELEINVLINRPYLRRLETIHDEQELRKFLKLNDVDVIIMEEAFVSNTIDLIQKYKNRVMLFNGNSNKSTKPLTNELVPLSWHFNYKLSNIASELIKIWHLKDQNRSFLLFVERARNFTISFYKRWGFLILISLVSILVIYGFYRRIGRRKFRFIFVLIVGLLVVLSLSIVVSKIVTYQDFLRKSYYMRHNSKVSIVDLIHKVDAEDTLTKVAALRALTERFIDSPTDQNFIRNKELITEKVLTSLLHEDERVRMWCLSFISKFNDESLVNFIANKSWVNEQSYLVRTRVVRVLGSMKNASTDQALKIISSFEAHPYVISHLKKILVMRENWPEEVKFESAP